MDISSEPDDAFEGVRGWFFGLQQLGYAQCSCSWIFISRQFLPVYPAQRPVLIQNFCCGNVLVSNGFVSIWNSQPANPGFYCIRTLSDYQHPCSNLSVATLKSLRSNVRYRPTIYLVIDVWRIPSFLDPGDELMRDLKGSNLFHLGHTPNLRSLNLVLGPDPHVLIPWVRSFFEPLLMVTHFNSLPSN